MTYPDLPNRSLANFVTSMEEYKAHKAVLSDCVSDNDDYHYACYDSHYDDCTCTGYYDYDDSADYHGYHIMMSSCTRQIRTCRGCCWHGSRLVSDWGAEGTEKNVIVDTGCQETILGTSVGERMCVADPCLVSAGSSPLVARVVK